MTTPVLRYDMLNQLRVPRGGSRPPSHYGVFGTTDSYTLPVVVLPSYQGPTGLLGIPVPSSEFPERRRWEDGIRLLEIPLPERSVALDVQTLSTSRRRPPVAHVHVVPRGVPPLRPRVLPLGPH